MKITLLRVSRLSNFKPKKKKKTIIAYNPILDFRSKKDSKGGKTWATTSGGGIVSRSSDYQKTACFTEISLAGGVRPVITSTVCPANFLTHIHHAPPTDPPSSTLVRGRRTPSRGIGKISR